MKKVKTKKTNVVRRIDTVSCGRKSKIIFVLSQIGFYEKVTLEITQLSMAYDHLIKKIVRNF